MALRKKPAPAAKKAAPAKKAEPAKKAAPPEPELVPEPDYSAEVAGDATVQYRKQVVANAKAELKAAEDEALRLAKLRAENAAPAEPAEPGEEA